MALVPSTCGAFWFCCSCDGLVPAALRPATLPPTVVFVLGFVVDGRFRFRPVAGAFAFPASASS
jgi:hypothetical protein